MARKNNDNKPAEYINTNDEYVNIAISALKQVITGFCEDRNEGKSNGGEVFTPHWTVVKMNNLADDKLTDINSKVLDLCCGTGNITIDILRRKLTGALHASQNNMNDMAALAGNICIACSSVYAIDIVKYNVMMCKERLMKLATIFLDSLIDLNYLNQSVKEQICTYLKQIFDLNIIWGDVINKKQFTEVEGKKEEKTLQYFNWQTRCYE